MLKDMVGDELKENPLGDFELDSVFPPSSSSSSSKWSEYLVEE